MSSLNLNPTDLAAFKAEALAKVDAEAEVFRHRFITPGSGQAMVYLEKEKEAEAFQVNVLASVPHIDSEAQARGISKSDMAAMVLKMAADWRAISPAIENMRIGHKVSIENATTVAEVVAASSPDWESLLA